MDPHITLPTYLPCRFIQRGAKQRRGLPALDRYTGVGARDSSVHRLCEDNPEEKFGKGDLGTRF